MMGRTHATSGAVLALAAVPALRAHGIDATGGSVIALAIAGAGGAMLPDLDHAHASIAQALGPVTKAIAGVVSAVSGGHRNGTHSILGIAAFTAIAVGINRAGGIAVGLWLAFLFAIGTAAMRLSMSKTTTSHTVLCLLAGAALVSSSALKAFPFGILPWGVAIGATAHLLGDMLTTQGVPLLWPVSKFRFKVANLTTDHFTERYIVGPGLSLVMVWQIIVLAGWQQHVLDAVAVFRSAFPT